MAAEQDEAPRLARVEVEDRAEAARRTGGCGGGEG